MKKTYKIICVLMIIMTIFSITYKVNAINFWEEAKNFISDGIEGKSESYLGSESSLIKMEDKAKDEFKKLIDFLWSIGLLTIFISTVVLGIKFMLVSPSEKSKIKQAATPYIVGVVIIFGALTIWKFVIDILDGSLA